MRFCSRLPVLAVLVLAVLAGTSCTWFKRNPKVLVTSEPPGARVFVDGTDTGQTTPAVIDIAGNFGTDHVVELRRRGYRNQQRRLDQHTVGYTSRWIDGASTPEVVPLFVFWTFGDFFTPFGVRGAIVPGELFVRLQRDDAPLLGFDLLEARKRAAEAAPAESR